MELQTLFKRESVADPFFIRTYNSLLYSYLNSGVPSVPYQDPNLAGWKAGSNGLKWRRVLRSQESYHACARLLRNAHLVEHLVALLHEEGALVGVGRHVRVVHLHHLHVSVDPETRDNEKLKGH
jgi:hypothetical protein